MILSRTRITPQLLLFFIGIVAATYCGISLYQMSAAHADTGGPAVVVAAPTDQPLAAYIALVLAGIATIISVLHAGLAWLAPRTETKIDDKLRDDLAEVLTFIRGPQAAPPTVSASPPVSGVLPLLAVFLLGLAGASQIACSTWRPRTANGAVAFLQCQAPHVDAALLEEAKTVTIAAVRVLIAGDGHVDTAGLRSAAAPLKSDLMRCAFDGAIAALTSPAQKPGESARVADAGELRAAATKVRAELGWPAQKGGV